MTPIIKVTKKPTTALFPVPTVLVTCRGADGRDNIITIAWTGVINSIPPMVYISVQPVRYSHPIIKETGEYVINIPPADLARQADFCGLVSGREVDKFKETGLTPVPASQVKAPLIEECPVNVECRVKQVVNLDSHDVFLAEVLAVHYSENVLDDKGNPDFQKIEAYGYCLREYRRVGDFLGQFGFSRQS